MADGTSVPEPGRPATRPTLQFGTITVIGGGCYGRYYVRQLHRAFTAGAIRWSALVVVDRDAECLVAHLQEADRPPQLEVRVAEWATYLGGYLDGAAANADAHDIDAIVPSPLMPHLLAEWIVGRMRGRWPQREVRVLPLEREPAIPWQRGGDDGTHYLSFAEWMCPINCIEPARCPHTRGPRDWSMPVALRRYVGEERERGRRHADPCVFHCTHRTHGVGMIDVADVLAADASVAGHGAEGLSVLVGTVSHCHGAVQRVVVSG